MPESLDILILGLGTSGVAVARYCAERPERFSSVTAIDTGDSPKLRRIAEELAALGVTVMLGTSTASGTYDVGIASPGIPPHAEIMRWARLSCAEVVSEIEFAYRESSATWVAVTGTNGKTTTTALVEHLLNRAGILAEAVGNIGTPAIEAVSRASEKAVFVAEVSSFQLALTSTFKPKVAVLLNITPDHIDWHGSLERYAEDKGRVFDNLGPGDVAVIDVDDAGSAPFASSVEDRGVRVVRVSRGAVELDCACLVDGVLGVPIADERIPLIPAEDLRIRGAHNVSNALAAAAAAAALGVEPEDLRRGLVSFMPIEHRLEPVATVNGAEWFNDSKATNPDAVSKALTAFGDRPVVLLLGGRNKGNDFKPLAREAVGRVRAAVLFGESASELAEAFAGLDVHTVTAPGLRDAVEAAAKMAFPGDAVVLSPACASFDEFANYEERGRAFKALVHLLSDTEEVSA